MQTISYAADLFRICSLSEEAVTLEFGQRISDDTLQKIRDFNSAIKATPFPGYKTTIPAYTTLTVFFDPLLVSQTDELSGACCFEKVSNYLSAIIPRQLQAPAPIAKTVTIPVYYGGNFGPDMEEVAAFHNLTQAEIINLHSSASYKVYMIGFVPGFAYLGGMSEKLATPRKLTPRGKIPPGSVGIAGGQTGVYPLETPGGWQIIGRTPLKMFNAEREQPSLLKAGDNVIFKAIEKQEFDYLANL